MESRTPEQALADAVDAIGSQAAMAKLLGISQPSVHKWVRDGKQLPAEHVLAAEARTGVSRHDLRPDLYPREGCCAQACPEHGAGAPLPSPAASQGVGAAGDAPSDALAGVRS